MTSSSSRAPEGRHQLTGMANLGRKVML